MVIGPWALISGAWCSSLALSPKQAAFIREYLVDLNGTQAAIRAGYSAKTAEKIASENIRKPEVKRALDAAMKTRADRVEVKADDVLRELMRIGLADPAACFDENGDPLPVHKMPKEARAFIAGVDYEELWEGHGEERTRIGNIRKLKFWNKPQALDLLGKHLKLFTERVEHVFDDLTDEQLEARYKAITAMDVAADRKTEGKP